MESSLGTVLHDVFGDENIWRFERKICGLSAGKLNFTLTVFSEKWLQVSHLPGKIHWTISIKCGIHIPTREL